MHRPLAIPLRSNAHAFAINRHRSRNRRRDFHSDDRGRSVWRSKPVRESHRNDGVDRLVGRMCVCLRIDRQRLGSRQSSADDFFRLGKRLFEDDGSLDDLDA